MFMECRTEMLRKTDGIVIKTFNYGEGSKIITLYTRNFGKVSVLAKGARKTKSRLHALTQIFSYGEYVFFMGSQYQMGTLNQGDLEAHFTDIYRDIEKTAYAAYIVELVDKITDNNEPNPYLFEQLLSSLEQINAGNEYDIVTRIFEMKIFLIAGYKPHLHSCIICGNEEDLTAFSIRRGGLICNLHKDEQAIQIQGGTVKLLRLFEKMDIKRLGNVAVKESTKSQLYQVMRSFYDEYIGAPLKSRNFLDQLKNIQ